MPKTLEDQVFSTFKRYGSLDLSQLGIVMRQPIGIPVEEDSLFSAIRVLEAEGSIH